MPQMMPINWLYMYFFLLIFNIMNYYIFNKMTPNKMMIYFLLLK